MFNAFINDVAQRVLTANKWEQRRNLKNILESLNLAKGAKALDFGCGTALFAPVFLNSGLRYYGYDIDKRLISYASPLYKKGTFSASFADICSEGPFDLVLANCCFHHIDDKGALSSLDAISSSLSNDGLLILIDIIKVESNESALHKWFMKLEKGRHVRIGDGYRKLVENKFKIVNTLNYRSHIFSIPRFPLYNDLAIFICKKSV